MLKRDPVTKLVLQVVGLCSCRPPCAFVVNAPRNYIETIIDRRNLGLPSCMHFSIEQVQLDDQVNKAVFKAHRLAEWVIVAAGYG